MLLRLAGASTRSLGLSCFAASKSGCRPCQRSAASSGPFWNAVITFASCCTCSLACVQCSLRASAFRYVASAPRYPADQACEERPSDARPPVCSPHQLERFQMCSRGTLVALRTSCERSSLVIPDHTVAQTMGGTSQWCSTHCDQLTSRTVLSCPVVLMLEQRHSRLHICLQRLAPALFRREVHPAGPGSRPRIQTKRGRAVRHRLCSPQHRERPRSSPCRNHRCRCTRVRSLSTRCGPPHTAAVCRGVSPALTGLSSQTTAATVQLPHAAPANRARARMSQRARAGGASCAHTWEGERVVCSVGNNRTDFTLPLC